MTLARSGIRDRHVENAKAIAAFGVQVSTSTGGAIYRIVREGNGTTLFTIGYERRDGEELVAALRNAGVEHLADVRDKPISRKPDFRASALKAICDEAGIEYGAWTDLGSTEKQRERLRETGNLPHFQRVFRTHAERQLKAPLEKLAKLAKKRVVALLCYERAHEECHRSIVADMVADRINATVTAIL